MLAVVTARPGTCPCKLQPGHALVYAVGGRVIGVDVGCLVCGVPGRVQPDDAQHGRQQLEVQAGRLVRLEPGWACGHCKTRQAVRAGMLEAA